LIINKKKQFMRLWHITKYPYGESL